MTIAVYALLKYISFIALCSGRIHTNLYSMEENAILGQEAISTRVRPLWNDNVKSISAVSSAWYGKRAYPQAICAAQKNRGQSNGNTLPYPPSACPPIHLFPAPSCDAIQDSAAYQYPTQFHEAADHRAQEDR